MKLTQKKTIILEMESKDFDSLLYFLQRSKNKIVLNDYNAANAGRLYDLLYRLYHT